MKEEKTVNPQGQGHDGDGKWGATDWGCPRRAKRRRLVVVYLKAVDSQGHIKAFIVRCGWQLMGVYLKAVDKHSHIKTFMVRCGP